MNKIRTSFEVHLKPNKKAQFVKNLVQLTSRIENAHDSKVVNDLIEAIDFNANWLKSFHFGNSNNGSLGFGLRRLVILTQTQIETTRNYIQHHYQSYSTSYPIIVSRLEKDSKSKLYEKVFYSVLLWNYTKVFIDNKRELELISVPSILMQFLEHAIGITDVRNRVPISEIQLLSLKFRSDNFQAQLDTTISEICIAQTKKSLWINLCDRLFISLYSGIEDAENHDNFQITKDSKYLLIGILSSAMKVTDFKPLASPSVLDYDESLSTFYNKTLEKVKDRFKAMKEKGKIF